MKEFNAENTGNRIVINCATIDEVKRLKQVIVKEIQKSPLGLKLIGSNEDILNKEIDIVGILEFIKNVLLGIESSDEFDEAIYNCLKHCTYKSTYRIDKQLFDNAQIPEAREDYYEIVLACVEENMRPFLKSLVSTLRTRFQNNEILQKLNLVQE